MKHAACSKRSGDHSEIDLLICTQEQEELHMEFLRERKQELIADLDYTKIHHMLFDDSGRRVEIWLEEDENTGKPVLRPVTMEQNTWQPGVKVVASFPCYGGNYDSSVYSEGWTKPELDEDGEPTGNYIVDDNHSDADTILTKDEMISRCIEEGDWTEEAELFVYEVLRQWEEAEEAHNDQ